MTPPYYNQMYNPSMQQNWNQPVMYPTNTLPQMNQMQQLQQPPQMNRPMIPGRIVNGDDEVVPNEVPGDGNISVFPLADKSKILVKYVTGNGTIATSTYVLADDSIEKEQTPANDILSPVMERLDNIEKMLKKNGRYYKKPQPKQENKE